MNTKGRHLLLLHTLKTQLDFFVKFVPELNILSTSVSTLRILKQSDAPGEKYPLLTDLRDEYVRQSKRQQFVHRQISGYVPAPQRYFP